MTETEFNIAYRIASIYRHMLPPHYYAGREDIDLVRDTLDQLLGPPPDEPQLTALDLGCGAGRITDVLAPYAHELTGTDKSAGMIEEFRRRFPSAEAICADTETVIGQLHDEGRVRRYELIGSFWSMSYPILECFEETTAAGVFTTLDVDHGVARARRFLRRLLELLAPGGHLVLLFFDANSAEQRLVTRLWERVAPFPGTGREFTWQILASALHDAELDGLGQLTTTRLPGVALASSAHAAHEWFTLGHLNALPQLLHDAEVHAEIDRFVAAHQRPDGQVLIPSAVHQVNFHADPDRAEHLPRP